MSNTKKSGNLLYGSNNWKKDYLELQSWQQHRVVIMVTKGKDFKDLKLRQGGLKWEREWKHLSVKSFKEEF